MLDLHFLALQLERPEVSSYLLRFDNAIKHFRLHDKSSGVVYNFEYVFGEGSMDRFRNEHKKRGTSNSKDPCLGIFSHIFGGRLIFSKIKTPSSFGNEEFLKSSGSFFGISTFSVMICSI